MIEIREFRNSDVESIYTIATLSFDEYYEPYMFPYFHTQWHTGQLVACNISGNVIGFISSSKLKDRATARILLLGVLPEWRNRSVGTMLLNTFRIKAMLDGIIYMTLEVRTSNNDARRFYHRYGFIETDILTNYYEDSGNAFRMVAPVQN
ncbi:MAG: GNAT family N-acetyltransferase [archaeon]|nr:GNAT family N-acetyltransferase [archaeon]